MWLEAGLGWKDFLPEDEDVNKFVTVQVLKAVLYCIDGQHNFYVKKKKKNYCTNIRKIYFKFSNHNSFLMILFLYDDPLPFRRVL